MGEETSVGRPPKEHHPPAIHEEDPDWRRRQRLLETLKDTKRLGQTPVRAGLYSLGHFSLYLRLVFLPRPRTRLSASPYPLHPDQHRGGHVSALREVLLH